MNHGVAVIIPAAGSGVRMGTDQPKQFMDLAGLPMVMHAVRTFQRVAAVGKIILVVPAQERRRAEEIVRRFALEPPHPQVIITNGGTRRQDSVANGLAEVPSEMEAVLVHDAARPLVSVAAIEQCIEAVRKNGAAVVAVPVADTLKAVDPEGVILRTVDRQELWQAQTPQGARLAILQAAFARAAADQMTMTDEASMLEYNGIPVIVVPGSGENLKVTRPEDIKLVEAMLMNDSSPALRIGSGFDAHRLVPDRRLVLGGVTIPHPTGLLGHSDADVVCHALCDAILGAIGAGDLGRHFPDTDPQFKGVSSIGLLEQVADLAMGQGYRLENTDITVVAQQPRLVPHFPAMQTRLASACRVDPGRVSLKATTTEGMGFTGREEGIAAQAVVLMRQDKRSKLKGES